jgi:hypothetical protein
MTVRILKDHGRDLWDVAGGLFAVALFEFYMEAHHFLLDQDFRLGPGVILLPASIALRFVHKDLSYWLVMQGAAGFLALIALGFRRESASWLLTLLIVLVPFSLVAWLSRRAVIYGVTFAAGLGSVLIPFFAWFRPLDLWFVCQHEQPLGVSGIFKVVVVTGFCFWALRQLIRPEMQEWRPQALAWGLWGLTLGVGLSTAFLYGLPSSFP